MDNLTQRLKSLSSAEDFLQFFGVPYDEHVVRVNRLHILKRFYQYLAQAKLPTGDGEPPTGLDEVDTFRQYREQLIRAHDDFTRSNAVTEKVFKVFQDADGQQSVPLDKLKASLAERRNAAAA